MPMAPGMTRKPSTCSLPASLLMERGLTPSSSFDGFSPTGSTCSLDKFASGGLGAHMTTPSQAIYHGNHERQTSRSSCNSVVIEESDAAILKVIPLPDTATNTDPNVFTDNSSKIGTLNATKKHTKAGPSAPPSKISANNHSPGGSNSIQEPSTSSWADQSITNDTGGDRPDWAILPSNGEVKQNGTPPFKQVHSSQSKLSGGGSNSYIIPIRTHPDQSNPFQQYSAPPSQSKSPHMPQRSRHTPVSKRNSSEGYSSSPTGITESSPTRHKIPVIAGNRGSEWNSGRHDIQQSTLAIKRTYPGNQQHQAILGMPAQYVNGVLKPVSHHGNSHGGILLGCGGGGRLVNHPRADPGPVTCFNCGKRGHIGVTCPANTMDTNNPDSESNSNCSTT